MNKYLVSTRIIDWDSPQVLQMAQTLSHNWESPVEIAKCCFEYVRDEIKHSKDYQLNPVTCKASDVLKYKTGYCYAKSHLLAALLRANNIPTGLCYQRLTIDNGAPPFACTALMRCIFLNTGGIVLMQEEIKRGYLRGLRHLWKSWLFRFA